MTLLRRSTIAFVGSRVEGGVNDSCEAAAPLFAEVYNSI